MHWYCKKCVFVLNSSRWTQVSRDIQLSTYPSNTWAQMSWRSKAWRLTAYTVCRKLKTTSVTWKRSVSSTLFIDWSGVRRLEKKFSIWKGSGWERGIKIQRREGGGWCSKVTFASFDFTVDSHSKPPRCMLVMWPTKEEDYDTCWELSEWMKWVKWHTGKYGDPYSEFVLCN